MSNKMHFKYKSTYATLTFLDNYTAAVSGVISSQRRRGYARMVMQQVADYADCNYLTLLLVVQRYFYSDDIAMNNEQLANFYSSFGFIVDPDAPRRPLHMKREPCTRKIHML